MTTRATRFEAICRFVATWWAAIKSNLQLTGGRTASLRQRFVHGSFWSLIGSLTAQGGALAASVIAARSLGKDSFGQLSLVQGTVSTAATFVGLGLGITATRYVAYYRLQGERETASFIRFLTTITLLGSIAAGSLLFLGAPYLSVNVFHLPALTASVRWAALYLFFVSANGVQTGILAGFESFQAVARLNITRGIVTLLLTIPLVGAWRVEGAMIAMTAGACLGYLVGFLELAGVTKTPERSLSKAMDWSHFGVLWSFSVPQILSGGLVVPVTWLVCLWLAQSPHGYAELGLFGAANQWRLAAAFLPMALSQPLLPLLTALATRSNAFHRAVFLSAALNGSIAAAVGLILICFVPLLGLMYGRTYTGMRLVMAPLMLSAVIAGACSSLGSALASQGKAWHGVALNLIWAFSLLFSAHLLIQPAGARGLAYSFLLAYAVLMVASGTYVLSVLRTNRGIAARRESGISMGSVSVLGQ
jgi:O-antigen/teichoic acid export membrane protein